MNGGCGSLVEYGWLMDEDGGGLEIEVQWNILSRRLEDDWEIKELVMDYTAIWKVDVSEED